MNAAGDDDIPAETGFSGATRGKLHRPNTRFNLPVYLDADFQAYLSALAAKKDVALSDFRQRSTQEGHCHPRNGEVRTRSHAMSSIIQCVFWRKEKKSV
jgi:hypothetical protein